MEKSATKQLLSWLSYPLVIAGGISAYLMISNQGIALPVATYFPVIGGALIITLLEWKLPYRSQWHPTGADLRADLLYMLLVQILLPRMLGFFIALSLLSGFSDRELWFQTLWVHDWPIGLQAIAMVLIADFLRYWVHRAAHHYSFLWRLHAVHHSADKLYWMNTGRFHPLEKTLQFVFDAMPFILLGVKQEVLGLYFVFYALNGFFQHSNIDLRFGLLNYIFSTAELHRWHHSKDIKESGTNYGNNTIVWDLLFGSWFLPKNKQVTELGLYNPGYPMSFGSQLITPFTAGLDKRSIEVLDARAVWQNFTTLVSLQLARLIYWEPLRHAARKPLLQQQRVLKNIITSNRDSDFGKAHSFDAIRDIQAFKEQVPIQTYDSLYPYINKQRTEHQTSLTIETPVYYARTSGTTGEPKFIPVLAACIRQHRRSLAIFSYLQYRVQRQAFTGKLLAIPGPYEEGRFDDGIRFGSISGLMYRAMPAHLKNKYLVPASVFSLEDHQLKYRLILRLTLPHGNLSYIASANPSTFSKLQDELNKHWLQLLKEIETGQFQQLERLPESARRDVEPLLKACPTRVQQLRSGAVGDYHRLAEVWPNIRLVVTWTGGSCGIAARQIKNAFPADAVFLDLGYLSSEMRGTITLNNAETGGLPTLLDNFFEFIEVNRYDDGGRDTLTLNELEQGAQYYIIVTTTAGLYRYFMNDIVEVTAIYSGTPMLSFIQKGKGVTNITGEKLTEQQVVMVLESVKEDYQLDIPFYLAQACVEQARYRFYLEVSVKPPKMHQLADEIDRRLAMHNVEYASKRDSGRLKMPEFILLDTGTAEKYKQHCIENGQRESQFKPPVLQYQSENKFPFEQFTNSIIS